MSLSEILIHWTLVDLGWLSGAVAAWAYLRGLTAMRFAIAATAYAAAVASGLAIATYWRIT
jgi:hypothetical protein